MHPDPTLMRACIREATLAASEGQYALAALVSTRDGAILALERSRLISTHDPTAHPEILALRRAAETMQSRYLEGCYLYTTLEPCPMCAAASIWAKLAGIVFGANQADAAQAATILRSDTYTWRQIGISAREVVRQGSPRVELVEGFLREECAPLLLLHAK
jgi:tRNA(Arg) A34 adenosine deaminase TadA